MDKTRYKDSYLTQLENLKNIVNATNGRIISDPPDLFFEENLNFFTKSFLITMCAYLESYLKDVLMIKIEETNKTLHAVNIPHNLVRWFLNNKELKAADVKYEALKIKLEKKELDPWISGNPYRAKTLFTKFGIDLGSNAIFNSQAESINAIVTKRNRILHYNDQASGYGNQDAINDIQTISLFIENIDKIICDSLT